MKDWRLSHKKFQPGFTLIEVLVALAIVAITVAAGMQAAGSMINNAERFAQINEAQWCADNHLTGLRLGRLYPPLGDSDFYCEQLGTPYGGKMLVRPTPNPNFRRVDAQILNLRGQIILSVSTVISRF